MAFTIQNNMPSAGCIQWTNLNMVYKGDSYAIQDGYTNAIYSYWTPAYPNNLIVDNAFPNLEADDCLIFLNKNGIATTVPTASVVPGDLIVPGSVTANAIAANTITGDQIAAGTIVTNNIAAGAISANQIAANAIGAAQIAANVITGDRLVADAITSREIATRTITANEIVAGAITANEIASATITAVNIAAGAITSNEIAANTITAADIASGTITATQIAAGTIDATKIKASTITVDKLASNVGSDLDISSNSSITMRATKDYVASRGENLVTNGTGLLGDNTNFSSFVYDGSDAFGSKGSFTDITYNSTRQIDELIPVNPDGTYRMTWYGKTNPYVGAKYYGMVSCYDCDKNLISPTHTMFVPNTLTTLAADLVNGATTISLTSSANWVDNETTNGTVNTHLNSIILWNYKNASNYQYPALTYSRNWTGNLWLKGNINYTTHVITLRTPWAGGTVTAGTQVSQGSSGGSYKYIAGSNVVVPNNWTKYTGTIEGIDTSGANNGIKFHPGTAFVKLGWLLNRDVTGSKIWISNVSIGLDVASQKDVTTAQGTADTAKDTADLVKGVVANDSTVINTNPIFLDWTGSNPNGYSSMAGTGLSKVTSPNGTGNSAKFVVGAGLSSYLQPTQVTTKPFYNYLTVESTIMLESGDLSGSGILVRYEATTDVDHYIKFNDLLTTPTLNKWYTVTKVIKQTANPAGFTGYSIYPMGGWTSFGTVTAKTIYFDSLKIRPSTQQEINAYESNIIVTDIVADDKISPSEKQQLKKEMDSITSEKIGIEDNADVYSVSKTAYQQAYNDLNTYLITTKSVFTDLTVATDLGVSGGSNLRNYFAAYNSAKATLLKNIADAGKTFTNNSVNNIQIGGRNLAQGTATDKFIKYTNGTISFTNGIDTKIIKATRTIAGSAFGLVQDMVYRTMKLTAGKQYTLSFEARGIVGLSLNYIYIMSSVGNQSIYSGFDTTIDSTTNFKKFSITFTKTNTSTDAYVMISSQLGVVNDWFEVQNIKVDEGNKSTSYTIAPEDMETRILSAEQKITPEAIVSTVRSDVNYTNDLGLKTDKTTIISTINQTAESVKISANKIDINGVLTVSNGEAVQGNIAIGKIVSGNVTNNIFINDGETTAGGNYTDFGAGGENSSNNNSEKGYVQYDLGAVYRISESRAFFYSGDVRSYWYKIKYSSDGISWYYAVGNPSNNGWVTSPMSPGNAYVSYFPTVDKFPVPIVARYIRLYGNGSNRNVGNHLHEWELYCGSQTLIDGGMIKAGTVVADTVRGNLLQGVRIIQLGIDSYGDQVSYADLRSDINGGILEVNNVDGYSSVTLGSETGEYGNRGGTLTLFDNHYSKKRVQAGTLVSNGGGIVQVQNSSNVVTSKMDAEGFYGLGRRAGFAWNGTITGGSYVDLTHNLGYFPIITFEGTTGSIIFTSVGLTTNQVRVRSTATFSGWVRMY